MQSFRLGNALVMMCASGLLSVSARADEQLELRVRLQAAMQTYIEANAVDGVLSVSRSKSDEREDVSLLTAHPKILMGKDLHVLCYDVVNSKSKKVDIDFFIREAGGALTVERVVIADHAPMYELMKAGELKVAQ